MFRFGIIVFGTLWLVMISCSATMKVKVDYDKTTDFTKYYTFKILPPDTTKRFNTMKRSVRETIEKAIAFELQNHGFREAEEPDLLIYFQTTVKDKSNLTAYQDYYGGRYSQGLPVSSSNYYMYKVTEGTLIIDLIDAYKGEVVWRALILKAFSVDPDNAEVVDAIYDGVEQAFKKFPPKR